MTPKAAAPRWKLLRIGSKNEEHELITGEWTIGRSITNRLSLQSIVISRNHCVLTVLGDNDEILTIKDLQSANGTFIGTNKITPNKPHEIMANDIIGIGWNESMSEPIKDQHKYVFKVIEIIPIKSEFEKIKYPQEMPSESIRSRLILEGDSAFDNELALKLETLNETSIETDDEFKVNLKRKLSPESKPINRYSNTIDEISLISDDEDDNIFNFNKPRPEIKKIKHEAPFEEYKNSENIKPELEEGEDRVDYFSVKPEYFDEDPIVLDSDDSDSDMWAHRLSQSSPGKPFPKHSTTANDTVDGDDFSEDLIKIPSLNCSTKPPQEVPEVTDEPMQSILDYDELDGFFGDQNIPSNIQIVESPKASTARKTMMIEPITQVSKRKSSLKSDTSRPSTSSGRHRKERSDKIINKSKTKQDQKEDRRRKLKELAQKEKNEQTNEQSSSSVSHTKKAHAKISHLSRGAFLTEDTAIKPVSRKEKNRAKNDKSSKKHEKSLQLKESSISNKGSVNKKETHKIPNENSDNLKPTDVPKQKYKNTETDIIKLSNDSENSSNKTRRDKKIENKISPHNTDKILCHNNVNGDFGAKRTQVNLETQINKTVDVSKLSKSHHKSKDKLRNDKTRDSDTAQTTKLVTNNDTLRDCVVDKSKRKKSVSFADDLTTVQYFEIEPGNQLKKTSLCRIMLLDRQKVPVFSLEKTFLMAILRWTPKWLEEQTKINVPPPILPHANEPRALCHRFESHQQYAEIISDLLLMEIWDCVTQAYMKQRENSRVFVLQMASPQPPQKTDVAFGPVNVVVNLSLPRADKMVPRVGELMLIWFEVEHCKAAYFFYVHQVKNLHSPSNNVNNYFSLTLNALYTDKMQFMKQGLTLYGRILTYIKNELTLMEAISLLAESPLSEVILRPNPRHFTMTIPDSDNVEKSKWTLGLNESQLRAVESSVNAALSDKPTIQMIQGPPGTGKSRVLCAIVMRYYYDAGGRRRPQRGKLLICATSNAAVDEIVIRLLQIRQTLPSDRFRMVRVGRLDAMHPRAREISSYTLALRDAHKADSARPIMKEEMLHLEAKLNTWRQSYAEAKDRARAAYCQEKIRLFTEKLAQVRGGGCVVGGGGEVSAEQVAAAERRVIECADIVVTTLASAANHKLKCLRRKIALCIIDEAGQALEPETLVPLTLDVTKLTLIGDSQQLPGYISSQRAKKYGLGESLFYRLSSCAEEWTVSPVILLDVQYRMHPEIADYPSRAFYAARVQNRALYEGDLLKHPQADFPFVPYTLLQVSSGDRGQSGCGANELEAAAVSRLVAAMHARLRDFGLPLSLAVITPYNAHKDLIRRCLKAYCDNGSGSVGGEASASSIEVQSVDSFQGQERDVVVVSLARSQGVGFLTDPGRMNVMLTRARLALVVCLNPPALMGNPLWRSLIEDAQERKVSQSLPHQYCRRYEQSNPAKDDILKYVLKPNVPI